MKPSPRIPILAVALSLLIPGLGQLYAGRVARSLAIICIGLASILLVSSRLLTGDPVNTLIVEIVIGSIYAILVCLDAWWCATKAPADYQPDERNRTMTYFWFVILFLITSGVAAVYEARKFRDHADTFRMAGKSMNPTLFAGDLILTENHPYRESEPILGEIVVYRSPIQRTQHWTSRVIATEGQTVEIRGGKLLVDGNEIPSSAGENGTESETINGMTYQTTGMKETADFGPTTVPPYQLFLLSDNRNNAVDSRNFGPVSIGVIEGRVKMRLWPRDRMGPMNRVAE